MDIRKEILENEAYIIGLRRHFHQYPELGMEEYKTAEKIKRELNFLGIDWEAFGETGVVGYIGDKKKGKTIALRADMDALKIEEKTGTEYASKHPGLMHGCGHDGHMASLLGAAAFLKKHEKELNGRVKLIFEPSEENCKGANLVCNSGILDEVEGIFGLHIFTDMEYGQISIDPGERMATTDIFKIVLTGKSGHAGKPQLCVDATVAGAALVMGLQTLVSRELNPLSAAVVSVGRFESGHQYNVVSGEAVLEGTVRSFQEEDRKLLEQGIIRMTEEISRAYRVKAEVSYQPSLHPAVVNDEEETQVARRAARKVLGEDCLVTLPKIFLGEDFSIYQTKVPGVFAFVGGGNVEKGLIYPNHHDHFDMDERVLVDGACLHAAYAMEHLGRKD